MPDGSMRELEKERLAKKDMELETRLETRLGSENPETKLKKNGGHTKAGHTKLENEAGGKRPSRSNFEAYLFNV